MLFRSKFLPLVLLFIFYQQIKSQKNETNNATEQSVGHGRALNITEVSDSVNTVEGTSSTPISPLPLDDLSLDDIPGPISSSNNTTLCQGKYEIGEKFSKGCEENCQCLAGAKVACTPRCEPPFLRRGLRTDPHCTEKSTHDECCVLLTCSQETSPGNTSSASSRHDDGCIHKNQTFSKGEMFDDGCEAVCMCTNEGKIDCKPRCPPNNATMTDEKESDRCVRVPDQTDPCCFVVLCDVTLGDHEVGKVTADGDSSGELRLSEADAVNSTAAIVHFVGAPTLESNLSAEVSEDGNTWTHAQLHGVMVTDLKPGKTVQIRVVSGGRKSNAVIVTLPKDVEMAVTVTSELEYCTFKGHNYTLGQEFNDACVSFCICTEAGVDCSPIECPSEFGLDVLDPTCLKWETKPRDFNPTPPNCCSDKVRCLDNGSCKFMGEIFPNWAEIPSNLTGCEKRCYCELGNVTCQHLCPEVVTSEPPEHLPCPSQLAQLVHFPGDTCCKTWACPTNYQADKKETSHNYLAPFGLNELGEPTEPPLPGPIRLPTTDKPIGPKIPNSPTTDKPHDTARIPGPPYHDKPSDEGFQIVKDEGIHGPPPFVIKPTKDDFDKKLTKIDKTRHKPIKPPVVDEPANEDADLGPFPFPHLLGNVFVHPQHPQNKPLPVHVSGVDQHTIYPDDPLIYHHPPPPPDLHNTYNLTALAGPETKQVQVQVLEPLDEHTVRLAFLVPLVLVGLHGRVEVRYTADKHGQDPSTWERQILAPPGDLIATPQLHFDLGNLLPDTTYSIFIKVILRGIANSVESPILSVRTLPGGGELTTLPPIIPIDPGLSASDVNATWVTLQWRKLNEFELQFIDGLQLRYREKDGKVFSATPLIHRSVTSYSIHDLKPNTSYEAGLFFIPFPGQTTELQADRNIHFVTQLENDPYKFEIHLDILTIKSTGVEVTWSGVPYPEDKYVNIYRVIYQSETGKEDFNSFKVAKRDSTPKITVLDLKPTTRYRLWLEAYLTNGRTKKSNVQDFVTKPGGVVSAGHSHTAGKLSGPTTLAEPGDYYGPLVAVAVLAALAIMAALILLLVLMRKHGQNKAPISSTRHAQSAYDNPSYKTSESDVANGNGVPKDSIEMNHQVVSA